MSAIGIDLGTTYSSVAVQQNGKIEVIANDLGSRVTPSYVAFDDIHRMIGDSAKMQSSTNPSNTLHQIKRLIGRKFDEDVVQDDMKLWEFDVINDENVPKVKVNYKEESQLLCAEEISAMILANLKETAEAYLGRKVTDAVITVPAHFNDAQRKATRDASTIAGLNVIGMINEPTAAALAYGLNTGDNSVKKTVLVFDLGGGTFDVTVIEIKDSVFDVLATGGSSHLGGEDFTGAMFEYFSTKFNRENDVEMTKNPRSVSRLRSECERAKLVLSTSPSDNLQVEALYDGIDFTGFITRSKFETLNEALFQQTMETVKNTMKDAGVTKTQIDDVVLVGGSTRIPRIRELLGNHFDKELKKTVNADEAIAYGAAVHAAILSPDEISTLIENVVLHDVAPLSLGIETRTKDMSVVIPRNTRIPATRFETFTTRYDNQTTVRFPVYEGERACTLDNRHLDTFVVDGLRPLPKGEVEFSVCFKLDEAGILTVTASDKVTGKSRHIVYDPAVRGNLSPEEVEKLIANAEKFKKDDEDYRLRSKLINELEQFIYNSTKATKNANTKGNTGLDAEKNRVLKECTQTMQWLKKSERTAGMELLEQKKEQIETVCHPFFAKLFMNQSE